MRISRWIWLLSITATTALSGCGSDFGGNPASDASPRDASRADAADALADSAQQSDGGDGGTGPLDGGTPQVDAADSATRPDANAPPDTSIPPPDASADTGAGDASDARDTRTDVADTRIDLSVDTGTDTGGRDAADGGPVGPDGTVGPRCGNGTKEMSEECDDGNTRDFDGCTSACKDHALCECCVSNNTGGLPLTCNEVEGDAEAGPRAGTAKSQLCGELYACLLRSRCGFDATSNPAGEVFMDCYCGAGNTTSDTSSCVAAPAGPCIAEMEGGMEAEGATWQDRVKVIYGRMTDNSFGGGKSMERWTFEVIACPSSCSKQPQNNGECPNPPGDAGTPGDAAVDTNPGADASDARADNGGTPDVSVPPDMSAPPDITTIDSVLPDGRVLTIDKNCNDCVQQAGQDPNACNTLTGTAAGGPAASVSKQQLCRETLDCIHQTNCHANAVHECYCGTAIDIGTCITTTTQANGLCKSQFDRSLEVPPGSAGSVALDRITDSANYAGGTAGIIATYEDTLLWWQQSCRDVCIPYTPTE